MLDSFDPIQAFWDDLLSEEPDLIRAAYASLDPEVRQAVVDHLKRMVTEEDWHPLQRKSAQAALDAIFPGTANPKGGSASR